MELFESLNIYYLNLEASVLSMAFLILIFLPMEKVFPASPSQKFFRKGWVTDLFFFLGQYILWGGLVTGFLYYISDGLDWCIPTEFRSKITSQPFWLQMIEVVVLSDFLIYWAHRLQHKNAFLWRFHKVHHSAPHLDWLAAHREHPLDSIYTVGLINLPAFIFDFPLKTIIGLIAFRGIWAIYIHSNVRFSFGPIRKLIGAPELHHWHHALDRNAGNYANISPLMDVMFGTYVCPDHEPVKVGIEESLPNNYLGQLLFPLLPEFLIKKINLRFNLKD
jgi:sterol desaturase/sphingolipid hydroxylase (fatty acid hydroxylase superfamily)